MPQAHRSWKALLVLVVATVKGWTVVAVFSLPCLAVLVVGSAGAAERRLVLVLGVEQATLVFDASETRLYVVELGGGDGVLVTCREDAGDLFLRVKDA